MTTFIAAEEIYVTDTCVRNSAIDILEQVEAEAKWRLQQQIECDDIIVTRTQEIHDYGDEFEVLWVIRAEVWINGDSP